MHDDQHGTAVVVLAALTNGARVLGGERSSLRAVASGDGADVFVGVSSGTVEKHLLATMSSDAMIFARSNPQPEVAPDVAARYA